MRLWDTATGEPTGIVMQAAAVAIDAVALSEDGGAVARAGAAQPRSRARAAARAGGDATETSAASRACSAAVARSPESASIAASASGVATGSEHVVPTHTVALGASANPPVAFALWAAPQYLAFQDPAPFVRIQTTKALHAFHPDLTRPHAVQVGPAVAAWILVGS